MPPLIYLDGEFRDADAARVLLMDRAYLYGDSIFETLRAYGGAPFRLEEHLDRLANASRITGIMFPEDRMRLAELIDDGLRRAGCREAVVRITISRGAGDVGIGATGCDSPVLSIIVRPFVGYPDEAYRHGIRSKVVQARRVPAACLDPAMKCGNYLPNIIARRELEADGMIEGVQLGVDGQVVSGTVSNVFLVSGNQLRTPDLPSGCLPGITRAAVLEIASEAGLTPVQQRIEPADLHRADEMFFTNTVMECLPAAEIDSRVFLEAPGRATRTIHAALRELVRRETATPTRTTSETVASQQLPPKPASILGKNNE